jgi:4-amino-4-deoxy-L-arabinose transferase-like glycosyltransferase
VDRSVFTGAIDQRVRLQRGQPFAVEWRGFLAIEDAGPQCFWTLSDDGSWLWIDDTLVVDNGGVHAPARVKGCVELARGLHDVRVRLTEEGGTSTLEVLWRQPSGRWVFFNREPDELLQRRVGWFTYRFLRLRASLLKITFVLWTAALGALVVGLLAALVGRAAVRGLPPGEPSRLLGVLAVLIVLAVWGLWWGLPAYVHWAPDELTPPKVLRAAASAFANGWFDFYPPLHYMLLAVPAVPLQIGWGAELPPADPEFGMTAAHVIFRLITVAMTAGLVAVLFRLGLDTIGRRGAVFACLFFIFSPTVVYYAKLSNVDMPYVFWVGLSLLFYGRAVLGNRLADYLALAATAAAAVCTKDQAYGFYVLMPVALIVANAVHRRRAGERLTPFALLLDRKFVLAALLGAALFALFHNLPFNLAGFRGHLAQLDENQYRAAVEPTTGGTWRLLGLNLRLAAWMAGWPAFALAAIGLVLALREARRHLLLVALFVPVVSYAVFFLGVVRYSFDRFLLGVWLVLALLAGKAAAEIFHASGQRRAWGRAAIAAALVYSALYGASVNAALTRDARYEVERYFREETEKLPVVGYFGLAEYLPRRQGSAWRLIEPTLASFCV